MNALLHSNHDRIDELIRQTDDPIVKAVLMLISKHENSMQHMIESLEENTHATKRIADTLHAHTSKEELFQSKIEWSFIGGRVVAVIAFGALSTLAGYIWMKHNDEADRRTTEVRDLSVAHQRIEQRMAAIEREIAIHRGDR
jgi:hypothetical protein